ncbi:MAG: tyrosine-type recombinase/integrase [Flavobacteriaceae bacterium]|nr:tyrosine-type recombinase/integrase [Flavobacteriaceae bacterium]
MRVKGFESMRYKFERDIIVNGKTQKTYKCYIRQIASISLYFNKLPFDISDEEIADYLFMLKIEEDYSESYFKFTVYGLRYLFRLYKLDDRRILLPAMPKKIVLPIILSKAECKQLFLAPNEFKDRFLLTLIYSSGLRISEALRLQRFDIDTDRHLLLVRQGKGKKDRYVVLSKFIAMKFDKYCQTYNIKNYVFPGQKEGNYLSKSTVFRIFKEAKKKCNITKPATIHTLRHCFATHMLENGIDIVTVKEQLGHTDIKTTMRYLQVSNLDRKKCISPLDTLYNIK